MRRRLSFLSFPIHCLQVILQFEVLLPDEVKAPENESLNNKFAGELFNYLKLERAEFSWSLVMVAVKYISNTQNLATFISFKKFAVSFPWRIV